MSNYTESKEKAWKIIQTITDISPVIIEGFSSFDEAVEKGAITKKQLLRLVDEHQTLLILAGKINILSSMASKAAEITRTKLEYPPPGGTPYGQGI
jgi:hypothetical protein